MVEVMTEELKVDIRPEDEEEAEDGGVDIDQYDITASPNDFNITTIFNFIESGAVRIPGFQRNYVWDMRRASKLMESIIIGIPIPQVFLYEEARNKFLVIDGQQRLMSIYYFMKQRFPRKEKRSFLRRVFDEKGSIPPDVLSDDEYFVDFNLQLPSLPPNKPNRLNKLNYSALGEYQFTFQLRTIRNVIIKQNFPKGDDSSIYEIFHRLNTGGVNLKPQEIRMCLYPSKFYDTLVSANMDSRWRRFVGFQEPDINMRDIEIVLRAFAMLFRGDNYAPSMTRFLNSISKESQAKAKPEVEYLKSLFESFLAACASLPDSAFLTRKKQFNISLFEAVFSAACGDAYSANGLVPTAVDLAKVQALQNDEQFVRASQSGVAQKSNVRIRLERARSIFGAV